MSDDDFKNSVELALEANRWKADQLITNHFGERVWLKQVTRDDSEHDFGYITDCCLDEFPCDRHAALVAATRGQSQDGDAPTTIGPDPETINPETSESGGSK